MTEGHRLFVAGLSAEEVTQAVIQRLSEENFTSYFSPHYDECAEDVVAHLLMDDDLDSEARSAILKGCQQSFGQLLVWLITDEPIDNKKRNIAKALMRLVSWNFGPKYSFDSCAYAALHAILNKPNADPEVRQAIVRACLDYESQGSVWLWKQILIWPESAAYAFNALANLLPKNEKGYLKGTLKYLWEKQIQENWPIDVPGIISCNNLVKNFDNHFTGEIFLELKAIALGLNNPAAVELLDAETRKLEEIKKRR